MKMIIALTLALAGMAANAFDFYSATDGTHSCSTYCTGFVTTDPAYTVESASMAPSGAVAVPTGWTNGYKVTLSVNGKYYTATSAIYVDSTPFTAKASDGSTITAVTSYTYRHTCTHSGRGQTCTTRYYINGGTITP